MALGSIRTYCGPSPQSREKPQSDMARAVVGSELQVKRVSLLRSLGGGFGGLKPQQHLWQGV